MPFSQFNLHFFTFFDFFLVFRDESHQVMRKRGSNLISKSNEHPSPSFCFQLGVARGVKNAVTVADQRADAKVVVPVFHASLTILTTTKTF